MNNKKETPVQKDVKEIQQDAVVAIMEKGVDFVVTVANPKWWHKLPFMRTERTFTIHPINLGSLLKISEELLKLVDAHTYDEGMSANYLAANKIIQQQSTMVLIVVYAIQNNDSEPSVSLISYLTNNLNTKELFDLMNIVLKQMNLQDFFSSTVLATGMNLMKKVEKKKNKINGKESETS